VTFRFALKKLNNRIFDSEAEQQDLPEGIEFVGKGKAPRPEMHVDAHRRGPYVYVWNGLFGLQRGGLQKVGFVSGGGVPAAEPAPAS